MKQTIASFVTDAVAIAAAVLCIALIDQLVRNAFDINASAPVILTIVCCSGAGLILLRRRMFGDFGD